MTTENKEFKAPSLMSREGHELKRWQLIAAAMGEYRAAGYQTPDELVKELSDLNKRLPKFK